MDGSARLSDEAASWTCFGWWVRWTKSRVLAAKRPGFKSTLCLYPDLEGSISPLWTSWGSWTGIAANTSLAWALVFTLTDHQIYCSSCILYLETSISLHVKMETLITKPWDSGRFNKTVGKCFGNDNVQSTEKGLYGCRSSVLHWWWCFSLPSSGDLAQGWTHRKSIIIHVKLSFSLHIHAHIFTHTSTHTFIFPKPQNILLLHLHRSTELLCPNLTLPSAQQHPSQGTNSSHPSLLLTKTQLLTYHLWAPLPGPTFWVSPVTS